MDRIIEDWLGAEREDRETSNRVGGNRTVARQMVALLLTELRLASAYVTIAKFNSGEEKGVYRETALRVYEMVARFLSGAALPKEQEREIKNNLADLKSGLQAIGENPVASV